MRDDSSHNQTMRLIKLIRMVAWTDSDSKCGIRWGRLSDNRKDTFDDKQRTRLHEMVMHWVGALEYVRGDDAQEHKTDFRLLPEFAFAALVDLSSEQTAVLGAIVQREMLSPFQNAAAQVGERWRADVLETCWGLLVHAEDPVTMSARDLERD